ncbi:MAG: phosphodiester glycosidase family protein [Bacteroidales bacterium]|nr:phosphodiester glycosidase family protein [Bacteroidales bacterium]
MKKYLILLLVPLLGWSVSAGAQRLGVREEVRADWNKSSGLDCVYDFSPKASTPVPKGYEAVYISHYGRHGSRYAYTSDAYTVILNMLSEGRKQGNLTPKGEALLNELEPFWDYVQYRVGDLTEIGWNQHQEIARTMVQSFPTVFGKGSMVDACSSASVRSIMSMSSCCAALSRLSPETKVYEHQGITDIQATRPNMGSNPFKYQGPEYAFPYGESSESFFFRHFPNYKDVLARLFKNTDAALGLRNPYDAFFDLYMFVAGMNSLPADVRVDVKDFFTVEEYATLWETDNYERFREYFAYRTPCSSIVDDMVEKATEMLAAGKRGAHLRYGHDHVVMALEMIMNLEHFDEAPENPDDLVYWFQTFRSPMAANIQYVFFQPKKGKSGDPLVKVLLNGEEAHLGDLEGFPYYRWDDVKGYLKERTAKFVYRPEEKGWTVKEVAPGILFRQFAGSVDGSAQFINVIDWDMSKPGYKLKFTYTEKEKPTSEVFKEHDAVVAMNACYEPGSVVLKVDGEYLSCMPNNTVMATGVPNWKSDAAIFVDGSDIRISYYGKGRTTEELRTFYANCTEPNIFSSAPMLIDDYSPVGESFAGFQTDVTKYDYEDARRHQGVRHPRTAVALTADNHFLMVVVDGRQPGVGEGMTAKELTRFLRDNFNPQYALNMDGGGSTTLCVEGEGDPDTHVVNRPSNKSKERKLYSHFCLVHE